MRKLTIVALLIVSVLGIKVANEYLTKVIDEQGVVSTQDFEDAGIPDLPGGTGKGRTKVDFDNAGIPDLPGGTRV